MNKTFYEKTLDFNFITRFLHNNKHKLLFNYLKQSFDKKIFTKNQTINIIDLGCGPAYIFPALTKNVDNFNYIGIEPRKDFFEEAKKRYSGDKRFKIYNDDCENFLNSISSTDIIISFDCFEHIPLDKRQITINLLSKINFKFMFVNIPNEVGPAILVKNLGSFLMGYIRHKEYTFLETIMATIYRLDYIKPHIDEHKGFDWRVLLYNLRFFFDVKILTSPFNFIPTFISPSIFFICRRK